jgi:hypothetical protein
MLHRSIRKCQCLGLTKGSDMKMGGDIMRFAQGNISLLVFDAFLGEIR